jgi:hypothetical protein
MTVSNLWRKIRDTNLSSIPVLLLLIIGNSFLNKAKEEEYTILVATINSSETQKLDITNDLVDDLRELFNPYNNIKIISIETSKNLTENTILNYSQNNNVNLAIWIRNSSQNRISKVV